MAIQVRRGKEDELDISKAVPGEWLVSTDTRYVRMCFAPGIVLRMATYEAFEADTQKFIEQMEQILSETKTVQEAVERIQNEIEDSVITVENYVESAKGYSNLSNTYAMQSKMYAEESNNYADDSYNEAERAKMYAENAEAVTNVKIASQTEAGLMRGGENYVDESGTLVLTKQTTDATLYNSYSGGLKINRITGASKQNQYTGRNLIPYPYYETTHEDNGITFTDNGDGSVTIDGTATGDSQFIFISRYADTMTLEAGTYTISGGCPEGGSTSTYRLIVSKNDAEGVASNLGYDLGEGLTFDVDGTETAIGVAMFINSGTTVSNLVVRPQLELGSAATDYEPYVGGIPSPNPDYPQEIQSVEVSEIKAHGKNLIPYPYDGNVSANGITYTDNGDGSVTVDGTATADSFYNFSRYLSKEFIERNTDYFLSGCPSGGSKSTYLIRLTPRNSSAGNLINFDDIGDGKLVNVSDTLTDVYSYGVYIVIRSGTTVSNLTFRPQLELGDAATDYEPYQESVATLSEVVTLHGINDVKDRIVRKDGVLCIERNLAEVVLDGSDEITYKKNDESEDIYLYLAQVSCGINTPCLCDKLSNRSISTLVAKNGNTAENSGISSGNEYENIYVNVGYIMSENTLDAFKAWLTENPLTVVYVPTEPTYESLPVADQTALMSLKTFDTVTYISTDSDIEPVIDVEYGTSRIGGYTLEALNTAQKNEIQYASLATLTNSLATALVAGSEE